MPFKFHASRRHHVPRAKYRVMNWQDYDRGLVRRGDIRFWIDESALEQWDAAKRRTPGGQRRFSELAISTTLMLGVVFRLPLRQTEGFVRSLVDLMGCDLPVPDHTTLSRRRRTVDGDGRPRIAGVVLRVASAVLDRGALGATNKPLNVAEALEQQA